MAQNKMENTTDIKHLEKKINEVLKTKMLQSEIIAGGGEAHPLMRLFGERNGERCYTEAKYSLQFLLLLSNQLPDSPIVDCMKTDFDRATKNLAAA
jgi:hypothetical protein